MIEYSLNEEKDFATYYAKELNRPIVTSIIKRGYVNDENEAKELSIFFWDLVDKTVEEEKSEELNEWSSERRFLAEKLLHTFSGHLESLGYSEIWDEEVDKQ